MRVTMMGHAAPIGFPPSILPLVYASARAARALRRAGTGRKKGRWMMVEEKIHTLVIGAGQAGLAMSAHLSREGISHLVIERHRIAERWRSERWDSLVANGPAWHDRFPDMTFDHVHPDGFATRDMIVDYFDAFAKKINAPVRTGVEAKALRRDPSGQGFRVETDVGVIHAQAVVVATGPFQKPIIPSLVPHNAGFTQLHSSSYRHPQALPEGGVIVIGSGSSGSQIADELLRSGRKVWLSIGPHDRPPRRYRGRDFVWWLGVLGKWNMTTPDPKAEHVTIAVSGAHGGHTVDFRTYAERGMMLLGRADGFDQGIMRFAADLHDNLLRGDQNYLSVLDEADAYVKAHHLDLPDDPEARVIGPLPDCVRHPLHELDLAREGISTILWSTGYRLDFSWIKFDIFDDKGRPQHHKGVASESGLYFLGLPWLSRRGSPFIWGVWPDAEYLAAHIRTHHRR